MDLSRFPRRRYTQGFTPLEHLPNFTKALAATCPAGAGPNVWIKRDDMLGLTPGGNKTRKLEFLVADALAQLPLGAREAAVVHLFETGAVGRLNAAVASDAAELYRFVATPQQFSELVHGAGGRFDTWARIKNLLSRLDAACPRANLRANALAAAFNRKDLTTPKDADKLFEAFGAVDAQLVSA